MTKSQSACSYEEPEYEGNGNAKIDSLGTDFLNLEIIIKLPTTSKKPPTTMFNQLPTTSTRRDRQTTMDLGSLTGTENGPRRDYRYPEKRPPNRRSRRSTMDLGSLPGTENGPKREYRDSERRPLNRQSRRATMDLGSSPKNILYKTESRSEREISKSTEQYTSSCQTSRGTMELGTMCETAGLSRVDPKFKTSSEPCRSRRATMDLGTVSETERIGRGDLKPQSLSEPHRSRRSSLDFGTFCRSETDSRCNPSRQQRRTTREEDTVSSNKLLKQREPKLGDGSIQRRQRPNGNDADEFRRNREEDVSEARRETNKRSEAEKSKDYAILLQHRKESLKKRKSALLRERFPSFNVKKSAQIPTGLGLSCDEQYEQREIIRNCKPVEKQVQEQESFEETNAAEDSAEGGNNRKKKKSKKGEIECSSDMKYLLKVHAKHTKKESNKGIFKKNVSTKKFVTKH